MIVVRIRNGIVDHLPLRAPEWFMGCMLMQFAVRLLLPGDTFGSSRSYVVMADTARDLLPWASPETAWGVFTLVVAGLRLFALTANGTFTWFKRWSPAARAATAFIGSFAWFLVATGMYMANRDGTGAGTYYGLTVADILLAIWVSGEAGHAYRRHARART